MNQSVPWWRLIPSIGWAIIAVVAIIFMECKGEKIQKQVPQAPSISTSGIPIF